MTGQRHDEVVELLPWFVNGTLAEAERARVERHVHACLTCYAALQSERRLASAVGAPPAREPAAERAYQRLMQRIDGDAPAWARARRRTVRRRLGASAALAAAAAVLSVAALIWVGLPRTPPPSGEFETTSTPASREAALDIVFAEGLAEDEMRALLGEIEATIVAGPTELGRYTVRLEAGASDEELAAIVERLRRDERVRFAGRSFIGEAP